MSGLICAVIRWCVVPPALVCFCLRLTRIVAWVWQSGDMEEFGKYFRAAKEAGLRVTMHIAEVRARCPGSHMIG